MKICFCQHCGNIVEMIEDHQVTPFCCGEKMTEMVANTKENVALEKHIPVYEEKDGQIIVKVGSVPHPMSEEHYISWVILVTDQGIYRHRLGPNKAPYTVFALNENEVPFEVYAYCNLHGLWKASID